MDIEAWSSRGTRKKVHGRELFVVDTGPGAASGETLVILHGYPTSSHDFHVVLPALAKRYRVVMHDHLGFGLSDKPRDYSYRLVEQADVALMVWRELGLDKVHVLAHDYGTSVATELLARFNRGFRPIALQSMILCNGSVHIELARLRLVQKLLLSPTLGRPTARLTNRTIFEANMRKLWHDRSLLSQEELEIMWQLLTRSEGKAVIPQITHYLSDRRIYWHRWIGALQAAQLPVAYIWGAQDPVVGGDVAELHHRETPGSSLHLLEGVGHYPMLEAPERWIGAVLEALGELGQRNAP